MQSVGGETIQARREDEGNVVPAEADRGGETRTVGPAGGREKATRHIADGETEGGGSHV